MIAESNPGDYFGHRLIIRSWPPDRRSTVATAATNKSPTKRD